MEEAVKIIWLFYLYSFIGWLWETVYCSMKARHFVYRGFLIGPITPIYGFGILGVLYLIEPFQNNILLLYLLSTVLVTALEYVTSYALEKLFSASWWDYKDVPFNINGRVALPVSVFWGFGCLFIVRILHPRILILEGWLTQTFGVLLPAVLIVVTLADLIYTVTNLSSFRKVTAELSDIIETSRDELTAKVEQRRIQLDQEVDQAIDEAKEKIESRVSEIQERVKERQEVWEQRQKNWLDYLKTNDELFRRIPKFNFNQRRIFRNFPNLKLEKLSNPKDLQKLLEEIRRKK